MGKLVEEILAATAAGLLINESTFFLTALASSALRMAVLLLPGEYRERYREEWSSNLADVSGPVSKLGFSLFLIPIGTRIRFELWQESRHADLTKESDARLYRLALLMLIGLVVRYRLRKIAEWFGFWRERSKIFGFDTEVFAAIVLMIVVLICGRQREALSD